MVNTGITHSRRWMAAVAAGVLAAAGLGGYRAMAASSPRPIAHPQTDTTSDFSVLIGPFKAKGGYETEIQAIDCGTKNGGALVSYERGNAHVALDHTYAGTYSTCTVSQNLESATLKLKWGTVVDLNLTIAGHERLKRQKVQGCRGTDFEYRTVTGTGTDVLGIHSNVWGRLVEPKAKVELSALVGNASCASGSGSATGTLPVSGGNTRRSLAISAARRAAATALARGASTVPVPTTTVPQLTTTTVPQLTTTTVTTTTTETVTTPVTVTEPAAVPTVTSDGSGSEFLGVFDSRGDLSIQSQTLKGYTPLTIINDLGTDEPAPNVLGDMDAVIQTPSTFSVTSGDDSAQVSSAGSFVTGHLAFTATKDCNGSSDVLDGDLTGRITVTDAVFGRIIYNGPTATGAAVGNGDADFGSC